MESIIDKILAIDRHAQQQIEDARREALLIEEKAEKESQLIKREIAENTNKRISQIEEQHKHECARRTDELAELYRNKTENMQKQYAKTHTEIENIIFSEITGALT